MANLWMSILRRLIPVSLITGGFLLLSCPLVALGDTGTSFRILGEAYSDKVGDVGGHQTRIVFYRPLDASHHNAATVYVNRMYHTSLVAGGYSSLCLRPGTLMLGVREMRVTEGPKDGVDSQMPLSGRAGKIQYVRVRESGRSGWALQAVSPREAEAELTGTRLQVHTRSRVVGAEACQAF